MIFTDGFESGDTTAGSSGSTLLPDNLADGETRVMGESVDGSVTDGGLGDDDMTDEEVDV